MKKLALLHHVLEFLFAEAFFGADDLHMVLFAGRLTVERERELVGNVGFAIVR